MALNTKRPEQTLREIKDFQSGFRTLLMATVGSDGIPEASYAPFVDDEHANFFVYISELAKHTQNLKQTKRVSVLFLEAEDHTKNLFARKRLTYNCTVQLIERGTEHRSVTLQQFRDRFGQFVDTIEPLEDFLLFQLSPYEGNYVKGFGSVYRLAGSDLDRLQQVTPPNRAIATSPPNANAESE